ncbi:hypothetical protein [Corynebacterium glyciniphilum]|nr:hypothetical protein [Corynebacterium glyciniphilum]
MSPAIVGRAGGPAQGRHITGTGVRARSVDVAEQWQSNWHDGRADGRFR